MKNRTKQASKKPAPTPPAPPPKFSRPIPGPQLPVQPDLDQIEPESTNDREIAFALLGQPTETTLDDDAAVMVQCIRLLYRIDDAIYYTSTDQIDCERVRSGLRIALESLKSMLAWSLAGG